MSEFMCPGCGQMHTGITKEDAETLVRQAQAFYVVASKINHVTTRGADAYLALYQRCARCGAPAADFVPAVQDDATVGTLPLVIEPCSI